MQRIGIYGGTFNPPHIGHIQAAEQARIALNLDKVLLIPDRIAPHKELPEGSPSPEQRLEMVRLAAEGMPELTVSAIELEREGTSYTYETLEQLKDFLERIVQSEGQPTAWETESQNGMYFYPQSIGDCPHMGQLHIYTQGQSLPDFTAYVNIRHFVRSIYRSLMAHDSGDGQKTAYKYLQSNMLEWYIDDESYEKFQMFRKKPQMAKWLSPAIVKFKDYLTEIYEGILNEDERV